MDQREPLDGYAMSEARGSNQSPRARAERAERIDEAAKEIVESELDAVRRKTMMLKALRLGQEPEPPIAQQEEREPARQTGSRRKG